MRKCVYGCEKPAKYKIKNGNRICSEHPSQCSVNRAKNSKGVKNSHEYRDYEYLKGRETWSKGKVLVNLTKVFIKNSPYATSSVAQWIIKLDLLEYKCSMCGIDAWLDKHITLELDHMNGINDDHRLPNLRFLCPNCHSQTPNFRGRGINKGIKLVSDKDLINALHNSKNIRQALMAVKLTPRGGNYARAKKLMLNSN